MILAIDTSSKKLGLALCDSGDVKASSLSDAGMQHGEILQQAISDLLYKAAVSFAHLEGVSVTLGPGSFTGLRIGMAAAKAYAHALAVPITGISTLHAAAHNFKKIDKEIMVIIDARKDEFYYARFDCCDDFPVRLTEDSVGTLKSLKKSIRDDIIFFGPGHLKEQFIAEIGHCKYCISDNFNLAEPAGILGEQNILKGDILDKALAVPIYLRSGFWNERYENRNNQNGRIRYQRGS
jgi:tRNA threonylcarbamoyladenosine biosynthesis protein TsaB